MGGFRGRVIAVLIAVALGLAVLGAYIAVVSQNAHAVAKPLYGPADFVQP